MPDPENEPTRLRPVGSPFHPHDTTDDMKDSETRDDRDRGHPRDDDEGDEGDDEGSVRHDPPSEPAAG